MNIRNYKTAFTIAKIGEIIGWLLVVLGILVGIILIDKIGIALALLAILIASSIGILFVFISQLTLIFIDTENNTRIATVEAQKTNTMLSETLGSIGMNLDKIAKKEN